MAKGEDMNAWRFLNSNCFAGIFLGCSLIVCGVCIQRSGLIPAARAAAVQKPPEIKMSATTVTDLNKATHTLGKPNAPITVIEFYDEQCPYCQEVAQTVFPVIAGAATEGRIKFIPKLFPLGAIHGHAKKAAEVTFCAGDQGKFWETSQALMGYDDGLDDDGLFDVETKLGLNIPAINTCVASRKHYADMKADMAFGKALGVQGTPTFFIGETAADGNKANGVLFPGDATLFRQQLNAEFKKHHFDL